MRHHIWSMGDMPHICRSVRSGISRLCQRDTGWVGERRSGSTPPCGTGTSSRMAQRVAKGRLAIGDDFVHESIIGTCFEGRVDAQASVAGRPAIRPSVGGWARVYGHNTITVDPRDPLWRGFLLV